MNPELTRLAQSLALADREDLRFAFGAACAQRVRHLLEDPVAIACVDILDRFVAGTAGRAELEAAAHRVAAVARSHPGSRSLDGGQHAAVSATNTVSRALAGQALEAASYAAYATVYAYGGYAVNDPASFEPEFAWQCETLRALAGRLTPA